MTSMSQSLLQFPALLLPKSVSVIVVSTGAAHTTDPEFGVYLSHKVSH